MGRLRSRGFAVVTVVFVMTTFIVLATAVVALLAGGGRMVMDEYSSQQAFNVAEAGIAYIAGQLSSDSDWSDNTSVTKGFGPGSFTVSFSAQTEGTATIRSDGTVNGITRAIQVACTRGGASVAFTDAFYTESDIGMSGSSSGTITGDIEAGGAITNSTGVVVTGDADAENSAADIPDPIWPYWQSRATTTITGDYNFASGTYSGIYYVTGNVTFSKDVTLNGTLVVRGSVTMSGNSNIAINAIDPNPAIIAEGAVLFTGTSDIAIDGWVVTLSTLTMTGTTGVTAEGGFIAAGDITFTGNSDTTATFVAPVSGGGAVPGFTGGEGAEPVIFGEWKEVS